MTEKYTGWPTKAEAAKMLEVSTRTIENMIRDGALEQQFRRGPRNSKQGVINPAELKIEAENKGISLAFVMPPKPPKMRASGDRDSRFDELDAQIEQDEERETALQVTATPPLALLDALTKGIADGVAKAIGAANSRQSVAITKKVYLTMQEAMELSGLSRRYLLDRIKDEKLTAFRSGLSGRGGWRIRREGLMKL